MASTIRTFVAVELQKPARQSCRDILSQLDKRIDGYRWVNRDNLHITLNFLGEVPDPRIPKICEVVSSVACLWQPFEITLARLGAFPSINRPRVVWIGVGQGDRELGRLQKALSKPLKPFGFARNRSDFHPHLTLGRIKKNQRFDPNTSQFIDENADLDCGTSLVGEVVVFSSHLERNGPMYTAMSRAVLGSKLE